MKSARLISVVIPAYDEEKVVIKFFERIDAVFKKSEILYEVVAVDDGSTDGTWRVLCECRQKYGGHIKLVRLGRNFGHQIAITAGERIARGQAVVVMDCDLQDPPELILEFIKKWEEGFEVVCGQRTKRKGETFFKRFTAKIFYQLMRKVSNIDLPQNVGDFYLLDRKVLDIINSMEERHRFLRGMVAWSGFRRAYVPYVRDARAGGKTKFNLWRMMKFSLDAFTSFSFAPLRLISGLGALVSVFSFLGIIWILYVKMFVDAAVLGWASLMVAILFIGGVQLLALGLIGEYLARIGDDVKRRPLYTVQEIIE